MFCWFFFWNNIDRFFFFKSLKVGKLIFFFNMYGIFFFMNNIDRFNLRVNLIFVLYFIWNNVDRLKRLRD